jgi:hypothetical protein
MTWFGALRKKGFQEIRKYKDNKKQGTKNTAGNKNKLRRSLSRTRNKVFELAICNPWNWYVTLTLDKKYRDRYNIDTFRKDFTKWLNNYNTRHETKITYMILPEFHKDKAVHCHGFFAGIPQDRLKQFSLCDKLPVTIISKIHSGKEIYTFPAYADSFGFIEMERIINAEAISKYITKYITKNLNNPVAGLNQHLYYASQGLRSAKEIYRGELKVELKADYENEYVKIKTVRSIEEVKQYFE